MRASAALAVAWALVVSSIVPPVLAQSRDDRPSARSLFLRGQESYGRGDYQAAIRAWGDAYTLDPRPLLQFNIAQAYEKQGKLQESIDALERYLATAQPDDAYQTEARARLGAVREKLRSTGIHVRGAPEGATIFVDDHDWGRAPRPDPVPARPGVHRVVVQRQGYRDFQASVTVPAGKLVAVNVVMVPLGGRESEVGDPFDSSGRANAEGASGSQPSNLVPFVLWGVAGAALVTGGVLGLMAMSQASDAPSKDSSEADKAKSLAIGADIAFGTALAAGTVGTVLFFVNRSNARKQEASPLAHFAARRSWSVAPVLSPTVQGASAYVRF